jgi:hypothetical protein
MPKRVSAVASKEAYDGLITFAICPPLGAGKLTVDNANGVEFFTPVIVDYDDSKLRKEIERKLDGADMVEELEIFKKKLLVGDEVSVACNPMIEVPWILSKNWGKIVKIRHDGMIDVRYENLTDQDVAEVLSHPNVFNPRSPERGTVIVTETIFEMAFKDVVEISSRSARKIKFNYEHELDYRMHSKCKKCGAYTVLINANQWKSHGKPEYYCLLCLPVNIRRAFDNVDTPKESLVCKAHIETYVAAIGASAELEKQIGYELPTKDEFDVIEELDAILDENPAYQKPQ